MKNIKDFIKESYDFEYQEYRERGKGENTYLQVAMMGSPESYNVYGGSDAVTKEYIDTYNKLCNEEPEDVLSLWRKCAYECNVAKNYESNDKYIVEEDEDGVYLMIRVDSEEDIPKYQKGEW